MKGGGKAPPPPDPTAVSQAQTQANQQTAQYNAALGSGSIFTPLGSSQFTGRVDPTTGATVYDQRVNLTPDAQAQLDSEMAQNRQLNTVAGGMLDRIGSTYGTPMDTSTLPKMLGADDLLGTRQSVEDAIYGRYASRLNPEFGQREDQLRTRLANQGIVEGSQAFENSWDRFGRERTDAYDTARRSAVVGGGDELVKMAGLSGNQRAQALAEALTMRNQPLNEFSALRNESPVQIPQFQGFNAPQMG